MMTIKKQKEWNVFQRTTRFNRSTDKTKGFSKTIMFLIIKYINLLYILLQKCQTILSEKIL